MKSCTFFGHRICSDEIEPVLRSVLVNLIERRDVNTFYIGHQGEFDRKALSAVRKLSLVYPHINYYVVLTRLPNKINSYDRFDYSHTLLPEGIENVYPKNLISWRNMWMINHSDYVIAYVLNSAGGAAHFTDIAKRRQKFIINIADDPAADSFL